MNTEYRMENREYGKGKIVSFKDLGAWREGHKLVLMVYQLSKKFPKDELFGLTNQIRRAAVSITSNIAEGFGRSSSKEKHQFYAIARGSVTEVQNQLLISKDVGYITDTDFAQADAQAELVHKIVTGLVRSTKSFSAIAIFLVLFSIFSILFSSPVAYAATTFSGTLPLPPNSIGLVGWWTFDGKNMVSNVGDSSGQGNTGDLTGATTTVPGMSGQALSFNGSTNYVTTGYTVPAQNSGTSFTWSVWAKLNSGNPGNAVIMGFRNGATWIKLTPSAFEYSAGSIISYSIPNNTWVLLTVVKNGSNFTYYQNGIVVGTASNSGSAVSQTFYMGQDPGFPGDGFISGNLDDARVYNRALSVAEIQQLYANGSGSRQNVSVSPGTLGQGLVGWWTFDGKSMVSNVGDSSGQGNNGDLVDITSTSSAQAIGVIGQALNFNGTAGSVTLPLPSTATQNVTMSAWVYWNGQTSNAQDVFYDGNTSSSGYGIYIANGGGSAGNIIQILLGGLSFNALGSSVTLPTKQWVHLVITRGTSTWTLYVNGVSRATGSASPNAPTGGAIIGGQSNGTTEIFNGMIDDVRFYNRTLSTAEVQALYSLGSGTHQDTTVGPTDLNSGLIGWWTFDGKNLISNVTDSSGQGNTGDLTGATTTVPGIAGQALNFNGSTNYISIPDLIENNENSITMSAWFKTTSNSAGGIFGYQDTAYPGTPSGFIPAVYIGNDGKLRAEEWDTLVAPITSSGTVNNGKWHLATLTVSNAANTQALYLDGSLIGTISGGATDFGATFSQIGVAYGGSGSWPSTSANWIFFNGSLDGVRIYSRALSAQEVQQLYQTGI